MAAADGEQRALVSVDTDFGELLLDVAPFLLRRGLDGSSSSDLRLREVESMAGRRARLGSLCGEVAVYGRGVPVGRLT